MTNNAQILSDHKKVGKKFIPPFINQLGETFKETSWVKLSVPELVWIALLNYRYGFKDGADLSLNLAKATKEATGKVEWYAPMSSFTFLTKAQKHKTLELLKKNGKLSKLVLGLRSLHHFYPKSTLNFLEENQPKEKVNEEASLSEMKNVLTDLYDKTSKEATFTQANAIYICFALGKLQVAKNSALANFPEIENYPNTEESKKIAASLRASINGFIGMDLGALITEWPDYFWNRGLEIDKCE